MNTRVTHKVIVILTSISLFVPLLNGKESVTVKSTCGEARTTSLRLVAQNKWDVHADANPESRLLLICTKAMQGQFGCSGKFGSLLFEPSVDGESCTVASSGKPADVVAKQLLASESKGGT
jgi:hypothetical protein